MHHNPGSQIPAQTGLIGLVNLVLIWLLVAFLAVASIAYGLPNHFVGQDAHAYWMIRDGTLYGSAPRTVDAFLYSPAFAAFIWPLVQLPWGWFFGLWMALETACLLWLVRPLPPRWAVPAFLACVPELVIGNIYLLLAAMVALGVRYPGSWAFGALTKITPGVGLLWHAARGEWRRLATGVALLVSITLASMLATPHWWAEWLEFLTANTGASDPTFIPRCLIATALILYGARSGRAWLLAPAITLSAPVLGAFATWTVLMAIPRLRAAAPVGDERTSTAQPREGVSTVG
jgi:hypothetical protein